MMAFLSLAAKAEIAMSMLTTYFIAGTIISSTLIFHSIYRGIQRAIKRQRVEEKRTAIQRPMIASPQLEAQLKAARAKPPAVAILKQCGVASAARGIVVLRDPSSSHNENMVVRSLIFDDSTYLIVTLISEPLYVTEIVIAIG